MFCICCESLQGVARYICWSSVVGTARDNAHICSIVNVGEGTKIIQHNSNTVNNREQPLHRDLRKELKSKERQRERDRDRQRT